jgi:hypothetical protein
MRAKWDWALQHLAEVTLTAEAEGTQHCATDAVTGGPE